MLQVRKKNKVEEARWRFFSGFIGGIISRSSVAPIERYIILRQTGNQIYNEKTMIEVVSHIWQREGPSSLFKGNGANCMRVGPFQAMEATLFDTFTHQVVPKLEPYIDKHFQFLFFGALSGAIATATVYPFDVTRTLLAVQTDEAKQGIFQTIISLFKSRGPFCLYKGLTASIIGVVPFASIKLTTNKITRRALNRYAPWLEEKVKSIITGGAAGSVALTVVYPLDVIRRKQHIELINKESLNPSYLEIIRQIYQTSKFRGFYVGLVATYVKVFPSTAVFVLTYEHIKKLGRIH